MRSEIELNKHDWIILKKGEKASSVFPFLSREVLYIEVEEKQNEANVRTLGKSLAKQSLAIIPTIRELDEFFDAHLYYKKQYPGNVILSGNI